MSESRCPRFRIVSITFPLERWNGRVGPLVQRLAATDVGVVRGASSRIAFELRRCVQSTHEVHVSEGIVSIVPRFIGAVDVRSGRAHVVRLRITPDAGPVLVVGFGEDVAFNTLDAAYADALRACGEANASGSVFVAGSEVSSWGLSCTRVSQRAFGRATVTEYACA